MTRQSCWWEIHEGVEILVADYRNRRATDLPAAFDCVAREVRSRSHRSVRLLSLAHGAEYSREVMTATIPFIRNNETFLAASAIVGLGHLTPLVHVINRLTGARIRAFDRHDEARRWLRTSGSL